MTPVRAASWVSQKEISPFRVEAARHLPVGCIATVSTSCECCRISVALLSPEYVFHKRIVLSQDAVATVVLPAPHNEAAVKPRAVSLHQRSLKED
jgi:hypothetical protein